MYAAERHREIVERARRDGRVDVVRLADDLQVTPETVRRDLTALERQGVLRRVHGGALPIERLGFEPGLELREESRRAEKDRIAAAALAEVPQAGSILLDAGTTTARLAALLPAGRELTVVTNALPIATALAGRAGIELHVIGGRVRGRTLAAVDAWAIEALAQTVVDVAFIGTNGISVARGLTTPDRAEAAVKAAMIRAARRTVVVADHTKVGNDCFAQFAPIVAVDTFITDDGLDGGDASELEASGVRVVRTREARR